MLRCTHAGRTKPARNIVGGMACITIGAGQIWNVQGREYRRFRIINRRAVKSQRRGGPTVAQSAITRNTRM